MEMKYNFLSKDLDQDKFAKSFEDPDTGENHVQRSNNC